MSTVAGPLPLPWLPIGYESLESLPRPHRKAPTIPDYQTRVSALDAEGKKLQIELAHLSAPSGLLDRAHFQYREKKSHLAEGELLGFAKSQLLAQMDSHSRRIAEVSFKITRIKEFSDLITNPSKVISYGIKLFLEFEYKQRWALDLRSLRGDNGFDGSIHKAWTRYEMHRESPDSEEAFRAYKALDNKRITLEKIKPLLERYLLAICVAEMGSDHSCLKDMLHYLYTGNGGLHELEAECDTLAHQIRTTGAILQTLDAQEYYNSLLDQRLRILSRLEEIEVLARLPTLPTDRLASAKELITVFDSLWSPAKMQYHSVPYNQSHFIVRAHAYNRQFTIKPESGSTIGFIGRKITQPGSHIFVRADLHGDLRSLVENLKKLQELGFLNEEFICAPNVQLVFLGDYMDRGAHTMQVLELLMTLRMQNPHHVTLIRGNHETIPMNMHPRMLPFGADENFKAFLTGAESAQNQKLLDEVYQTLPLAYFIGEANPEGIQYTMFTHGLFELYADPQEILSSVREEDAIMHIQRAPSGAPDGVKGLLSDRVRALPYEEGKNYPILLREPLDKPSRKILKLEWAAQRINALAHVDARINANPNCTSFYWGDIQEEGACLEMGNPSERKWKLPIEDIKLYLQLISGPKGKVKLLFRGHEHLKQHHAYATVGGKEKVVATTMPVGMDSLYTHSFTKQKDTGYIITTGPKIRDWTKSAMERVPGTSVTTMGPSCSLRDKAV